LTFRTLSLSMWRGATSTCSPDRPPSTTARPQARPTTTRSATRARAAARSTSAPTSERRRSAGCGWVWSGSEHGADGEIDRRQNALETGGPSSTARVGRAREHVPVGGAGAQLQVERTDHPRPTDGGAGGISKAVAHRALGGAGHV